MQDVLYYFAPSVDATITISLCGSHNTSEPFDTTLLVVTNLAVGNQLLRPVACNTNFCGGFSQVTVSCLQAFAIADTAKDKDFFCRPRTGAHLLGCPLVIFRPPSQSVIIPYTIPL